jgi:hypothetical protein
MSWSRLGIHASPSMIHSFSDGVVEPLVYGLNVIVEIYLLKIIKTRKLLHVKLFLLMAGNFTFFNLILFIFNIEFYK